MLRKFVVILTMLLCSMATQLYALGLGAVTVESSLNQPLRMRIELLQLGDTKLQDIRVAMASNDDFRRFNVDRHGFLSNIRFSVEAGARGNVVILTSSQIVREPYLSFILETRWPNGRLLSEHTVLLDLPVFNNQQSADEVRQPISPILQRPAGAQTNRAAPFVDSAAAPAVVTPSSSSSAGNLQPEVIAPEQEAVSEVEPELAAEVADPLVNEQPETEIAEPVVAEPVVAEPVVAEPVIDAVAEPEAADPETIPSDDFTTLSDIALQVRPDNSVSMQQTMLAIQQVNPDAFADGNINRLRSGQVLRIPTLEEVQSIDPRDAVQEVSRQNQDFADTGVQPLAAPADAAENQDAQAQGQLSVISSDAAIDASSGAAELGNVENEVLDQRIAALETQLAQRQEEADRARIERSELNSRMQDLEAQIAAAQEIIRLQDIQLAQLQDSLVAAAAEAQLAAEQQAIQVAAAAEAAETADSQNSLLDGLLRIVTANSIFMIFAVVLVILLLVGFMLRRNRASKLDEDEIDEFDEPDFDAESDDPPIGESELDESVSEFQDYDSSELDSELDDIIGVADDDWDDKDAEGDDENPLDVLTIAEQLISEEQYRRALSLLNTSLQEQGESEAVRAKIDEIEAILELEAAQQRKADETARATEAANREMETKSFLDDLGIDLDSFGDDDDENSAASEAELKASAKAVEKEKPVEVPEEDEGMDLTFDLGGGDDASSEEEQSSADGSDDEDAEAFEFDLDDDSNAVISEAKDPEDMDLDSLEFDSDAVEDVKAAAAAENEQDLELETFSFDAEPVQNLTDNAADEEDSAADEADSNAVEFSFDKTEIKGDTDAATENAEVETFDFDLDDDESDTVLEKPASDVAPSGEAEVEAFDFDLDEFDVEPGDAESASSDAYDDFLDLDAEEANAAATVTEAQFDTDVSTETKVDFDFDDDKAAETKAIESDEDLIGEDDLEFLSDDADLDAEDEMDMLSDDDEAATKLELAYAYQKMGDTEGAKEILQEVIKEGSDEQVAEANKLLGKLDEQAD